MWVFGVVCVFLWGVWSVCGWRKGGFGAGVGAHGSGLRGGVCVVGVCCFCGLTKID